MIGLSFALVLGRTNGQCCQRWAKTLDPGINKGKWTPEKNAMLIETVQQRGNHWVAVAALVPVRDDARVLPCRMSNCNSAETASPMNKTIEKEGE
jgi:hypothetical protein